MLARKVAARFKDFDEEIYHLDSRKSEPTLKVIISWKTPEGVSIGVAPESNLLVAGVLIGSATLRTLFEGLSWAVEKGADIISMSLGFSYYEPLFANVFTMLTEQYGILPVAAIGNENYGNSSSPGNAHSALSVGAAEKVKRGVEVAFFSSGASLVFSGKRKQAVCHET
jgi:hypothetical protein